MSHDLSVIKPAGGRRTDAVRLGVDVLTVGQAAAVCGCAPRTVARWLDAGVLRGYRLPMSADRRVPASVLAEFLAANGMSDALAALARTNLFARLREDVLPLLGPEGGVP